MNKSLGSIILASLFLVPSVSNAQLTELFKLIGDISEQTTKSDTSQQYIELNKFLERYSASGNIFDSFSLEELQAFREEIERRMKPLGREVELAGGTKRNRLAKEFGDLNILTGKLNTEIRVRDAELRRAEYQAKILKEEEDKRQKYETAVKQKEEQEAAKKADKVNNAALYLRADYVSQYLSLETFAFTLRTGNRLCQFLADNYKNYGGQPLKQDLLKKAQKQYTNYMITVQTCFKKKFQEPLDELTLVENIRNVKGFDEQQMIQPMYLQLEMAKRTGVESKPLQHPTDRLGLNKMLNGCQATYDSMWIIENKLKEEIDQLKVKSGC